MVARSPIAGLLLVLAALFLAACGIPTVGLHRPNGVALAKDGTLLVMDRASYRIAQLTPAGRLVGSIGAFGTAPGAIHSGWDIALDSAGNIYICHLIDADAGEGLAQDSVKVFAPSGAFVREFGRQTYEQDGIAQRNDPYGLDIDSADRVYVADSGANALRVFDTQGRLLARYFGVAGSEPGEFRGLRDVVVDDARGLLYATDAANSRVQQFRFEDRGQATPGLVFVRAFGQYGSGPGRLAFPQNIAVDERTGDVYVGDLANRRVQVFDTQGAYLRMFSAPGVRDWQVMGVAVGPDGAVYVADALNDAIWVFEPDGRRRAQVKVRL